MPVESSRVEEFIFQIRLLVDDLLLGLLFHPEDGGNMFLRNVGGIQPNYTPLLPQEDRTLYNVMNLRIFATTAVCVFKAVCLNKSINVGHPFASLCLNVRDTSDNNVACRPVAKR
jgi:hypothetical protein